MKLEIIDPRSDTYNDLTPEITMGNVGEGDGAGDGDGYGNIYGTGYKVEQSTGDGFTYDGGSFIYNQGF